MEKDYKDFRTVYSNNERMNVSNTASFVSEGPLTNQATRSCPRDALDPIGPMKPLPGAFDREQRIGAGGGVPVRLSGRKVLFHVAPRVATRNNTSPPHCLNTRVALSG